MSTWRRQKQIKTMQPTRSNSSRHACPQIMAQSCLKGTVMWEKHWVALAMHGLLGSCKISQPQQIHAHPNLVRAVHSTQARTWARTIDVHQRIMKHASFNNVAYLIDVACSIYFQLPSFLQQHVRTNMRLLLPTGIEFIKQPMMLAWGLARSPCLLEQLPSAADNHP